MRSKFFIILLLALFFNKAHSQDTLNFNSVDKKSYELFLAQQWDSLSIYGETALQNDIDYFYLRLRIGIAYYNLKSYRLATPHFEKALKFNSSDAFALEYLYYSYLFSGQTDDAFLLSTRFTDDMKKKILVSSQNIIQFANIESGMVFSNNIDRNKISSTTKLKQVYVEQDLYDNSFYAHAGVKHRIGKYITLYEGYSKIIIDKYTQNAFNEESNMNETSANFINNYYYKLDQNQYYLNANLKLPEGFKFIAACHLLQVSYPKLTTTPKILQNNKITYLQTLSDTSFYNAVASVAIKKELKYSSILLGADFSNLNNARQMQFNIGWNLYPFANSNLYISTGLTSWTEDNTKKPPFIFDILVGAKITNWMWAEAWTSKGQFYNYSEKNAFLVYNTTNRVKSRFGVNLIFLAHKRFDISLRYQLVQKDYAYIYYAQQQNLSSFEKKLAYNSYTNQTIVGGIKWKF